METSRPSAFMGVEAGLSAGSPVYMVHGGPDPGHRPLSWPWGLRDAIAPTVGQALVVGLHPVWCRTRRVRLRELCPVIPMGPRSPIACIGDVAQCNLCETVSVIGFFRYRIGF